MAERTRVFTPDDRNQMAKIIADGKLAASSTPDMPFLQRTYWYVPVFLYGAEKRGFSEWKTVMKSRPPHGRGLTRESFYTMKLFQQEPLVFAEPQNATAGRIHGEVYLVSPSELCALDQRYMNGPFSRRQLRLVRWYSCDDKDRKDKELHNSRMWMYVAWAPAWEGKQLMPVTPFSNVKDQTYYNYHGGLNNPLRGKGQECLW